jgi:hypothetical protein
MGIALVKYVEINNTAVNYGVNCKVDADCFAANTKVGDAPGWAAITSTAAKAKTCCMYESYVSIPAQWTN